MQEIWVWSLSCMDRGTWQATVREVCKESDTTEWLTLHFIYNCIYIYIYQHTHFLYLSISKPPLYLDVPNEWILANRMQAEVISSPQTASMYYFSFSLVILWMNNNTCVTKEATLWLWQNLHQIWSFKTMWILNIYININISQWW